MAHVESERAQRKVALDEPGTSLGKHAGLTSKKDSRCCAYSHIPRHNLCGQGSHVDNVDGLSVKNVGHASQLAFAHSVINHVHKYLERGVEKRLLAFRKCVGQWSTRMGHGSARLAVRLFAP